MIIHDLEQNTQEWLDVRLGVPTASSADKLVTSKGELSKSLTGYAEKLAGEKLTGKSLENFSGNKYTENGHEMEDEARDWYSFDSGNDVEQTGFITDDLGRYGCSPDGLVGDDGLVEIKCLPVKHIGTLLAYKKNGKLPADYYQQVQMQLLVTDRQWCDRIYYHPDLPKLVVRQGRDDDFIKVLKAAITACIKKRDEIITELEGMAA